MQDKQTIIVLGAGPAGLGAASQVVRRTNFRAAVLERNGWVGGNASSFKLAGINVDYGSHRLHPSCDAEILTDIQDMLGGDLLDRPRHGRIRLRGRWIHFPLKSKDLVFQLPPGFSAGVGIDFFSRLLRGVNSTVETPENFASVLLRDLGKTICNEFYFPYARKLWGLEPDQISAVQAQRRVSNNTLAKMVRKAMSTARSAESQNSGRFYYPRRGFGQISQAYYEDAQNQGADIILNAEVKEVSIKSEDHFIVIYQQDGETHTLEGSYVWSTIPITILLNLIDPSPSKELLWASRQLDYRAMILIYLVIEADRFSEYDAHYFPESGIRISRLSEPKNYSGVITPKGLTVICAELPCAVEDAEWRYNDQQLANLVKDDLETAGIPVRDGITQALIRRLRYAYPIYRQGYEVYFNKMDDWVEDIPGLLSFGRQGLFAHDNTHHALFMSYSAVKCLNADGSFDRQRWQDYRRIFKSHVVVD